MDQIKRAKKSHSKPKPEKIEEKNNQTLHVRRELEVLFVLDQLKEETLFPYRLNSHFCSIKKTFLDKLES